MFRVHGISIDDPALERRLAAMAMRMDDPVQEVVYWILSEECDRAEAMIGCKDSASREKPARPTGS